MTDTTALRLFEVTSWGNTEDPAGVDDRDTNFLVCARDHEEAARLVAGRRVQVDTILELGASVSPLGTPMIVRGPYLEHRYNTGRFPQWDRQEFPPAWVPRPFATDGEATCTYADGTLAARIHYRKERMHGRCERWYANGRPMHAGDFRRDEPVGLHEWWYESGQPAARYEYTRHGVSVTEWDEYGALVREETEDWRALRGLPPADEEQG